MKAIIARALKVAARETDKNPSDAMKAAGNYKKGKITYLGMPISIENPKGSKRSGTTKDGKRWECTLPATYGYLLGTRGADKDHVDVYIGEDHDSNKAFVIDQVDAKTKAWDEHKTMLGFSSEAAALQAYAKAFSDGKGKERVGAITEMPVEAFKAWVKHGDTKKPLALKGYASGGAVQGLAGGGSNWRASAAPYGLQQLAFRLGYSVDDLINNPQIVAAAVAQMEDPRGANHVAESFMDMYDRNGGGREGLMRTIAGYDTMTMRNGRTIGSLAGGDINQTIANLNAGAMQPTVQHLSDVTSGTAERILPEGYTQNFSPAAARVQPIRPGTWGYYQTPQGQSVYAPVWAAPAIRAGTYTMTPSGEYMVPDTSQKPFQVNWSRPQTPDNGLPNNSSIALAEPQSPPTQAPTQRMALGRGPSDLPPMTLPRAYSYPGDEPSKPNKSSGADWVESGLGLVPKWSDDSTALQPLGFADGGVPYPGDMDKNYLERTRPTDESTIPSTASPVPLTPMQEWQRMREFERLYLENKRRFERGEPPPPWPPAAPPAPARNIPQMADGGAPSSPLATFPYPGDEGRYATLEADSVPTLDDYAPLRKFEPFPEGEIRGRSQGESRDPFSVMNDTLEDQVAQQISPTMGGYGMGQAAGGAYLAAKDKDWAGALGNLAPIALGMALPVPGVKGMGRVFEKPELDARGFYSPTLEAAKILPQEKGTVGQFRSMLLDPKHGGKPKELEALGFDQAFPDPNAKVSRSDIETFLRENRVGLGQTGYGGDAPAVVEAALREKYVAGGMSPDQAAIMASKVAREKAGIKAEDPRFESYSTPGGIPGSYREVVTTLPPSGGKFEDYWNSRMDRPLSEATPEQRTIAEGAFRDYVDPSSQYTSTHWPGITNPLLHYRVRDFPESSVNTRLDAMQSAVENGGGDLNALWGSSEFKKTQGEKTRVLDELQSDWGQNLKNLGARDPALAAQLHDQLKALHAKEKDAVDKLSDYVREQEGGVPGSDAVLLEEARRTPAGAKLADAFEAVQNERMDLSNKWRSAEHGVPSAPFISNTSDWVDLGLKQALMEAAKDPSVSRFAWAPGRVQIPRYPELYEKISAVRYNPDTKGLQFKGRSAAPSTGWSAVPDEVAPDKLASYVGDATAKQLLEQPRIGEYGGFHTLDRLGPDAEVMGKRERGQIGFYGDFTPEGSYNPGIVGTRLSKLIKAVTGESAKIEGHALAESGKVYQKGNVWRAEQPVHGLSNEFATRAEAEAWLAKSGSPYPSISITPQMREALKKGLPLFLAAGALLPSELGLTPDTQGASGYPPAGDEGKASGGGVTPEMKDAFLREYYGREANASPQGTPNSTYPYTLPHTDDRPTAPFDFDEMDRWNENWRRLLQDQPWVPPYEPPPQHIPDDRNPLSKKRR